MQRRFLKFAFTGTALAFLTACGGGSSPGTPPTPTPIRPLYVAESGLNQVGVYNMSSGTAITTIAVGTSPKKLSYDGLTKVLWVANSGSNTASAIDTTTNTVVATVNVGTTPVSVLAATNYHVYVANQGSKTVSVIDPSTKKVVAGIQLSGTPFAIVQSNQFAAVAETDNTVEIIDMTSDNLAGKLTTNVPIESIIGSHAANATGIVTADGVLHKYDIANAGWPWTEVETVTLPDGAGPASDDSWGRWLVASQANGTVQDVNATVKPGFTKDYIRAYAVGTAPEYAAYSVLTGDDYVPNAGSDSITVIAADTTRAISTWKLPSGAVPYDVALAEYTNLATPAPAPQPTVTPSPAPTATPDTSTRLYVANNDGDNLLVFNAPFGASSAPGTMVDYSPAIVWGVAANHANVAVTDGVGTLRMYSTPVTATPYATFNVASDGYLAFDGSGKLFVTTQASEIDVYSPPFSNSSAPSQRITGAAQSNGLALDPSGNLYVGNIASAEIDVFAPPYTSAPVKVRAPGANAHIIGLAATATTLYVSDATNNVIDAYTLPLNASSMPAYSFSAANPRQIAVDPYGDLFVGDSSGSVDMYLAPLSSTTAKWASITTMVAHPLGIAVAQ